MSQEELRESPDEPQLDPVSVKGYPKTAWALVVILVLASVFWQSYRAPEATDGPSSGVQQDLLDLQGQYLVAASKVPGVNSAELYRSIRSSLNQGPLATRLSLVVLAGELIGPDEALEQLDAAEEFLSETPNKELSPQDEQLAAALRRLYSDYQAGRWDAPSLESEDRDLLNGNLGWFGKLALAPHRSQAGDDGIATTDAAREEIMAVAWRTFGIVVTVALFVLVLCSAGLLGATAFLIFFVMGKIRSSITTRNANSGVYAETFAFWLFLFLVPSVGMAFIVQANPDVHLIVNSVVFVSTLAALAWPVVRGVPWNQVRREIGWTAGRSPIREIGWGVACYVSNLPVVAIGLVVTLALNWFIVKMTGGTPSVEQGQAPMHPVVEWARDAVWYKRAHILLLAAVIAPIVEETIFRGVLYRHLREGTAKWRTGASIALSVLFNSFIFAAIHPQGLLAVPALMSVAAGLSLAREWRSSLIAPMVMHGVSNGVLMLLLFALL